MQFVSHLLCDNEISGEQLFTELLSLSTARGLPAGSAGQRRRIQEGRNHTDVTSIVAHTVCGPRH